MPIHDWTRVEAGIYHHFHGRWLFAISDALNGGLLPPGYYALAEQTMRTLGPDVLALHNPASNGHLNGGLAPSGGSGGVAVAEAPPQARIEAMGKRVPLPQGQRRLSIRHISDHRVIAIVELVSPGNKSSDSNFETFVSKACGVLHEDIHLLVIDPFPPGPRDPDGMHGAIWSRITGEPFERPGGKPLTLAAYRAGEDVAAFVDPIAVGEPLPDKPLFLDDARYVNVPLEATYQAAWQTFPAAWRAVLTG